MAVGNSGNSDTVWKSFHDLCIRSLSIALCQQFCYRDVRWVMHSVCDRVRVLWRSWRFIDGRTGCFKNRKKKTSYRDYTSSWKLLYYFFFLKSYCGFTTGGLIKQTRAIIQCVHLTIIIIMRHPGNVHSPVTTHVYIPVGSNSI